MTNFTGFMSTDEGVIDVYINGHQQAGAYIDSMSHPKLVEMLADDDARKRLSTLLHIAYQCGRADVKRDIRKALGVQQ